MTLNAYLNRFRSVKVSPWPCSQCCEYSDENNIASVVENTSWKPLEMPFLRLKRLKMSLDASALKNLGLWCKFQSHLLFIISLLLENFLTALLTCLLDSACAKPNDSCKCWNILSRANWPIVGYSIPGAGIPEWDTENDTYRLHYFISPQSIKGFRVTFVNTDRLLAIRLSLQYNRLHCI